ncbi:T9SS type B sorting domain-containing protein [Winogradskyella endarachnes]|uniref:T9SS type B sorting domain-containing protein n=1 Tax=Winogradskyella endarachnes TaxID=2681965 RepID=A0A6L6U696_9FLAO|nr:T9SS type B sorting domain-containing protein [Winogradskyella endarachnes]MUU77036.1 T9SS type B sorting domain-containing protein [Winogradskyella endarachnes]
MKKPTFSRITLIILLLLLGQHAVSQNLVPFSPRYDEAIKGDMLLIGNSNVGLHASNPYNGTNANDQVNAAVYVDIDGDASTFNSSSADLDIPSDLSCYQIVYAGLYWSAVVDGDDPISDVKFKVPGGSYVDITGTEIYYQNAANNSQSNTYAYYHDVTDMLTALADPEGTYTVANISSLVGPKPNSEGLSAGWSLFVIYEDPLLPSKYITSFDGFTKITSTINETFPVSGFNTIPTGPVRAKFAFSTIEGDRRWTGDYLRLNGTTISVTDNGGNTIRPANNFFNSTVSDIDPLTNTSQLFTTRNPNSSNTLGFDAGIINIPNPGNSLIANNATSANISLGSNLDIYYYYFSAFAIEIIAPNIVLTKIVEDEFGNNIGDQLVNLGAPLNYVIGFQNTGNDDATNFQIRDILPVNIVYNHPTDLVLPPGVTASSYNPVTRELIFDIDDSVVEQNDPVLEIRIEAQVVDNCSELLEACSNLIQNQAFASYQGTINPDFTITDDPSLSSNTGCLITPQATNFLADLDCGFQEDIVLCGESVELTAANGYDTYAWSTSPTGTPVIGTGQSITVTETGSYYSYNTAIAPCQSIVQRFNVELFGNNTTNPVIPYADEVVICPNNGKELPNIFLCGANDFRDIQTNISDSTSIIWEKLDETSCAAVTDIDCANEEPSCTWNSVGTNSNFVADTAGQYRITINYPGGCFVQFYFNVYENLLSPTVNATDIICTTDGSITVNDVPSGYEYSLDNTNFQSSNIFSINTAGTYTIYIRQIGVDTNPCIFTVPDVLIRDREFTASTTVTQPLCHGDKGSINLAANDADPQYSFTLTQSGTLVNSIGPIVDNNYTFENLNAGTYTATIESENGCVVSEEIEIVEPALLTATIALTTPLSCEDGVVTVYPVGGTSPYYYFVNGSTDFQSTSDIIVSSAGTYNVEVVDANNCSTTVSINVDAIAEPEYNVTKTDITCEDDGNTGTITVNLTNANGSTILYSIDGGTTYQNSNTFTGLSDGSYDVVLQYTSGTAECTTTPETIVINSGASIVGTADLTAPLTCLDNGTITVTNVTGGDAPYTYSIDGVNFQTSNIFNDLSQGTYTIIVQDDNGCTSATNEITIAALNPPTDLTFDHTAITCPTNTSTITITGVTGGIGTLEYQITAPVSDATPYQTSTSFANLEPGTYTFQVKDENDCVYSETYTVDPIPVPTLAVVLTKDLDCTTSPDAVITGTITGPSPYTYAVSFNGAAYTDLGATGTPFNYAAANDGTYQFQITDANGCIAESSVITVDPVSLPELSVVVQTQPILCNGDTNGAIDITIDTSVGTPPYVTNVNNDTTGTDYGTQTSSLPAGTYTITITDAKSCTVTETIIIDEPDAILVDYDAIDITCDTSGISQGSVIINSVVGGTSPYNYFVTGTNGYSNSELNNAGTTSVSFDVVDFGLYEINVVDANGCSVLVQDVLVASPPTDLDINISTTTDCLTGGEAEVSVGSTLSSSGPFYFAIYEGPSTVYPTGTWLAEDAPGSQSATFTGLMPDVLYTFIVYDQSTNCSYYEPSTIAVPTNSTLTTSAFSSNNITCTGSADGNVTFTVNSIYTSDVNVNYEIFDSLSLNSTGIVGSGSVPANGSLTVTDLGPLPFGNYFVSISETSGPNSGCGIVTAPFNITESAFALELVVSIDQNANCNPNSGVISAIASNGTSPYRYQITTSSTAPLASDTAWSSASTFNEDAGSYYVHVIDAYNCIVTSPVQVLDMDPTPVIAAVNTNQCTVAEGEFEIDVTLDTAGMPPYTVSINGGAFQTQTFPFTLTNLYSGSHSVEVKDVNGCGNIVNLDIQAPILITPEITALPSCNNDDGEITVTGNGGSGSYTYSIAPNPSSITLTGNVFSGVPSGTYTITITDALTLCTEEVSVTLSEAIAPTFTLTPTSVTCFGDNSGSFDINIENYTGNYTYQVFDTTGNSVTGAISANTSTNPLTVSGMEAGTFSVVITETDFPFCSATSNVIITSPAAPLTLNITETSDVTCNDNQGTITAIASGGWGDLEYELTGDATVAYSENGTFTDLSAGTYVVNVRDSGGCIVSESIILETPDPITATFTPSTTMLSCFGDQDASITITNVTGGQESNYSYTLNTVLPTPSVSGPQTSNVFENLGPGTYFVVITDGYDCELTSVDIVISEPTPVVANLVRTTTQTCLTESTLTLSATGGTGIYSYSANASFSPIIGTFTSSTTFSVPDGTYSYYVRDANGCETNVSNEITVEPLPTLTVSLESTNPTINCAGDNNGTISATAIGGLGNYTYTLQDASGNPVTATQNTPGYFTELYAGDYTVLVESGDCVATSEMISITEPDAPLDATLIVNNITCAGNNNGSVEITATGGTGVIKYAISPQLNQFFDNNLIENLEPGAYDLIVQDELGCFLSFSFTILEPAPVILSIVPDSLFPEVCSGDEDGEFSISISGGTLPYSVSLDDYEGVYTVGNSSQNEFDFTNLPGGDHTVYVRDAEGCESQWNITFPESVTILPEIIIENICEDNTQGNVVTVMVDESITDLTQLDYSLNGGPYQESDKFINVPVGTDYFIEVRHTNGCVQTTELFDIEATDPITLTLEEGELNEFIAVAAGGEGGYQFTMNGEDYGTQNSYIITESGTYEVIVTDSAGCYAIASIELEFEDICIPNWFTPDGDGNYDTWAPGCTENYPNLTFDIFDRYGRKIAEYHVGEAWDGKYKGRELPTGDYWFVVKTNDSTHDKDFVGHFTLYR